MGGETLFFDYKCDFGRQEADEIVLCSDWCPRDFKKPLLVVGSSDGSLNLFHDEGERVDNEIKRAQPPTCCAWGPAPQHLLATGWHDGAVSLWSVANDEKNKLLKEDKQVHTTSICLVKWSPNGERLVSADQEGNVGVWKPDERGRLVSICKIRKGRAAVTHVVFRTCDTRSPAGLGGAEAPNFYFAGEDGVVYIAGDDATRCREVLKLEGPDGSPSGTAVLMYFAEQDQLVGINDHLIMTRVAGPDDQGQFVTLTSAKLSARAEDRMLALWAAPGLLLTSSSERILRLWNLAEEDNYVIAIEDLKVPPDDKITAITYSESKRVLAAGTQRGYVLFWFNAGTNVAVSSAEDWQPLVHATTKLDAGVSDLKWAHNQGMLCVSTDQTCSILIEHVLQRRVRDGVSLVQVSNRRLGFSSAVRKRDSQGVAELDLEPDHVQAFWSGKVDRELTEIQTAIPIKGCDNTTSKIAVWSGRRAEVYEIDANTGQYSIASTFDTNATAMAIGSDSNGEQVYLFMAVESRVEVANLQGRVTQTLTFGETEGVPTHLDSNGGILVASTSRSIIRMWDIRRKEAKQTIIRKFEEGETSFGEITSLRVNSDGSRISILARNTEKTSTTYMMPQSSIYVYDVETDTFMAFDCGPRHYPVGHAWDSTDTRLLGCETKQMIEHKAAAGDILQKIPRAEIITFFATSDKGVLMQDRFSLSDEMLGLLGMTVPNIFMCTQGKDKPNSVLMHARLMRDFVGMDKVNTETRRALLEFSFQLTMGNMDEAYKAVKLIKSSSVWENMAHMCVKTARLDVAEQCLSNMGNARGAKAVRESKIEPEPEARIAMVALQLGLIEDAERLYLQCGRYDLLNKMYQAAGEWDKALDVGHKKDRINLRTTHYKKGQYHESFQEHREAISAYELADAHRVEVPRMLHQMREMQELDSYVQRMQDKKLFSWWGQSLESNGKLDSAANFYYQAEDWLSLVRVCCFKQNFPKAEEVINEAMAKEPTPTTAYAAAFFLASQYEALDRIPEAVHMYAKAGRYYHSVRLARQAGMDKDLVSLALQAPKKVMLDTARYFESKDAFEQAVVLFQKGGDSTHALEICFNAKLFDSLRAIADDLGSDTDPALLAKVGDFFMSHSQYDKAVQLFITGRQPSKAMDLCEKHNVNMTEDMAERITDLLPSKEDDPTGTTRNSVLKRIADQCVKHQNYHLATKKYTQAGMKDKAMDALLKSGDTEKIIFFAGVLRSKEIYIRAANYLQTLNWHTDAEVMKKIIEFYTKAKAYQPLALFYDACSQVEIDEYRDYEKALGALRESRKFMAKAEKDTSQLDARINMVDTFVTAKGYVKSDPQQFVRMCHQLIEQPRVDAAVQVGDVFALLIEYFYSIQDHQQAMQQIDKMRSRRIAIGPYLDQGMVDDIYKHMGVQVDNADEDHVDEDIADDM